MWGNVSGWISAVCVGLIMAVLLWWVASPPTPTEPTNSTKLAIAYKPITLPVGPEVVATRGTKDCDAGDAYRKAIEDYRLSEAPYEKFQDGGAMKVKEQDMPAIADIVGARDCKDGHIFASDWSKIVNYDNTEPPLEALNTVGTIACTLGKLYTNEKYNPKLEPEHARQLWESAFMLGWDLYDERATFAEYQTGYALMQMAGANLRDFYHPTDPVKADKIDAFLQAQHDYSVKLTEAWQIIGNTDENYAGKYAGDIREIALSDKADPLLRVEALKHEGHYRFNALTSGDQLAARRVLRKVAESPTAPPQVKAAAQAGLDLTIEKHRMVGGAS